MRKCIALVLCRPLIMLLLSECPASSQAKEELPPIIDMHLHAPEVAEFGAGAGPTPRMCSTNEGTVQAKGCFGPKLSWVSEGPLFAGGRRRRPTRIRVQLTVIQIPAWVPFTSCRRFPLGSNTLKSKVPL